MTDNEIREYLGHNGVECLVEIRHGHVQRYGSTDPTDRSMDFWQDHGALLDWRTGRLP